MNSFTRIAVAAAASLMFAGCATNPVSQGERDQAAREEREERCDFMTGVLQAISAAPARPIKLADVQKDWFLHYLIPQVRRAFFSEDLSGGEFWASWGHQRDKVTFVRYSKDRSRFVYAILNADAALLQSGGGGSAEPPWTK